jgi:hypothetical protein
MYVLCTKLLVHFEYRSFNENYSKNNFLTKSANSHKYIQVSF